MTGDGMTSAGMTGTAKGRAGISDLASQVLDLVRGAVGSAGEAEVVVDDTEQALTRFANSFIHQNVADATVSVQLRLHHEGRTATGSTTVIDTHGLTQLVDRTVAATRLSPPDPLWPGLAPPAPVTSSVPVDVDTAHAEPGARAERVRAFVGATEGLEAAGYCSTLRWSVAFANSAGQTAAAEAADASMDAIARLGTSDGLARLAVRRLADLDGAVLGRRAAAKARAGVDPVELPPGRYEVVLEATAVADLLINMALYGFNGKAVVERRSFADLGAGQFDPAVSLVDDPAGGSGLALPFDIEGTPRRVLTLVDTGVTSAVAHDRRSARQAGTESTGHAIPGGASWGAFPTNLHLVPRNGRGSRGGAGETEGPAADASVAELVAQVSRGLLVTDNWYTRVLDPRSLVVTGLTRNGVWLIEDGEITTPVQNLRFTQSYPEGLGPGAVLGVGSHSVALPSDWGGLRHRAPALRLASWQYTGNASG
jgi:predicted Zn-dependent protease